MGKTKDSLFFAKNTGKKVVVTSGKAVKTVAVCAVIGVGLGLGLGALNGQKKNYRFQKNKNYSFLVKMTDLWKQVSFENNPIKIDVPVQTPKPVQPRIKKPIINKQQLEEIKKYKATIGRKREIMQGTYNKERDKRRVGKARLKAIARKRRALNSTMFKNRKYQ